MPPRPARSRRQALLALGAWAVAPLTACATARAPEARRVAEGVYVVPGIGSAADADNQGRIGNTGFVVGPTGVVLVDTGTSLAQGRALLAAVAAVTDHPVRLAIVTHTQPEFLFGGGALQERGIPVAMHLRCATLMASRCDQCLKRLRNTVGEAPFVGTALYAPDRRFEASHREDTAGRSLQVLFFGHSSGPGDVAVFDETSGTLFAGGLLEAQRVPDIQDSDLPGWRRALAELRRLPLKTVVPAHGPVSTPGLIDEVDGYLQALESTVRRFVEQGGSLLDVADATELPAYAGWDEYATIHRRNASIAYLRIERELLFK